MKRWPWLLLGGALFLLALLVQLPASLVLHALPPGSPLGLDDVRGSLWSGSAGRLSWQARELGALSWQVAPAGLLRGRLEAELVLHGGPLQARARVHRLWRGWRIEQGQAQLPADWFAGVLASPGLAPRGRLQLDLDRVEQRDGVLCELQGRAQWQQAMLAGPGASAALGDLQAEFALGADGRVHGQVGDHGGPLALSGDFVVDPQVYRATLRLDAREPSLRRALQWLGQAQADGSRLLLLEGLRR